jgi:hypothetical protein
MKLISIIIYLKELYTIILHNKYNEESCPMALVNYIQDFFWYIKKKIYYKQLERNNGFFDDGIHHITKTHYDRNGYDIKGFDDSGYNINHLDRDGFNKEGIHYRTKLTSDEFSKYNFSIDVWYQEKRDFELLELKEKIARKPRNNYNEYDFDEDGFHKYLGFNIQGYNRDGFDKDGYDIDGWDKYGFTKNGIHIVVGKLYYVEGRNFNTDDIFDVIDYYPRGPITKEEIYKRLADEYSLASQIEVKRAWDQYIADNEDIFKRVIWANKRVEYVPYVDEHGQALMNKPVKEILQHSLE